MDGVLVIDKPSGMSSFDVIRELRRSLNTKKMGHLGTLDPIASGVLVVFLGKAIGLIRYFDELDKVYEVSLELGKRSDTYDRTGSVEKIDSAIPSRQELESSLADFLGQQWQIQPAYSALKVAGKRAYERARAGETLDLGKRQVIFHSLEVMSYEPPIAQLRVHCSHGTYVRSLVHELGESLGCGAIMTQLRRESVGPFTLSLSCTPDGARPEMLIPPHILIEKYIDWKGKARGDKDLLIRQFVHSSTPDRS